MSSMASKDYNGWGEDEEFRLEAAAKLGLSIGEASKLAGMEEGNIEKLYDSKLEQYETEHIPGYFTDRDLRLVLEGYLDQWRNPHEISGETYAPSSEFSYQGSGDKIADILEVADIEVIRYQRDIQESRAKADKKREITEEKERLTERFEATYPGAVDMYMREWMSIDEIEEEFEERREKRHTPSVRKALRESGIEVGNPGVRDQGLSPEERIEEIDEFSTAKDYEIMAEVSDEDALYWMVGNGINIAPDMAGFYNQFMDRESVVNGMDIVDMMKELEKIKEPREGLYRLEEDLDELVERGEREVLESRMKRFQS